VVCGFQEPEKIGVMPAGALPVFVLRNVLLNPENIVRCRDERKKSNDDRSDANCLEELTAATRMTRNPARGAQSVHQGYCPEDSPGQIEDRVVLQRYKNTM
jgi:hypothetical protein